MSKPTTTVYLNGQFMPRADARLSIEDRGFLFGDGVYEVTRVVNGRLVFSDRHLRRLQRGLDALQLTPKESLAEIEAISQKLIEMNGLTAGEATVYLEITRGGTAPRTHHFSPAESPCTVLLWTGAFDVNPLREKRTAGVSVVTMPDIRWARCDLKTVNLLPNVMAKQKAVEAGAFEALFVKDGVLMEGSASNAFFVKGGVLYTHPATNAILPGITREVLLELARAENIPISEAPVFESEIPQLDECFMAGTTTDVMPVVQIDGQKVGNGQPGPIAKKLYDALARELYGNVGRAAA